jgi:hypothetical protein
MALAEEKGTMLTNLEHLEEPEQDKGVSTT